MARAAVVDVTVDDDLNIFALALLGGRPHVMSCSLLTHGKRKVMMEGHGLELEEAEFVHFHLYK